ncbi:beta-1,3-galactosyltransferase 1-like [Stegodyphus dumicola]|uniref:beta-1,3-galactosyltransferase 1-like n=1 Tax=Stegodyphus dumicola TaxID=202533 RepID=UPI0015AC002D|nr:beta-1,3-galactosyltransferase 1-like [Stegodyphus dumicola]
MRFTEIESKTLKDELPNTEMWTYPYYAYKQAILQHEYQPTKKYVKITNSFRLLINEPHFCLERQYMYLISVSSSAANTERRTAIRNTWGNQTLLNQTKGGIIFLLGKVNDDRRLQMQIYEESMRHRDIIQGNFADAYRNLTLKSVMALKWFSSYCPRVRFLMKTDDDIYVNANKLSHFLYKNQNKKRWIVGCVKTHARLPFQMKKNVRISSFNLPAAHPTFVAGAGYIISSDIVEELHEASEKLTVLPVEDVFITGHCSKTIGVKPEHDFRFSCGEAVQDYCHLFSNKFTGHRVSAQQQVEIWKYANNPRMCKKKLYNKTGSFKENF